MKFLVDILGLQQIHVNDFDDPMIFPLVLYPTTMVTALWECILPKWCFELNVNVSLLTGSDDNSPCVHIKGDGCIYKPSRFFGIQNIFQRMTSN